MVERLTARLDCVGIGERRAEAAGGAEQSELVEAAVVGFAVHEASAEVVAAQEWA